MTSLPRIKSQLQPILLKGHERSITSVKYNKDGDFIFTCAKDNNPTIWDAETGERIGTYEHHKGAVWDMDPNWDSTYLVTACADGCARLFEVTTGRYIARMPHRGAVRSVSWGDGSSLFATASDPFNSREQGLISIFEFPNFDDEVVSGGDAPLHTPILEIPVDDLNKAVCLGWTNLNEHLIAGFDNGLVIKYDPTTGEEIQRVKIHEDRVNRLTFNAEKTLMITASKDTTAKLIDPITLNVLKVYKTDRPVNAAVINPVQPHVLLGGGQDAMSVTVTAANAGKFETRFFHMIYNEEFGRVKGHFGPINAIGIHPQGKSYASGSEDGFIRLHHFDSAYLRCPTHIPDDIKVE
jgi:translation initiation factor 3 subunit I